MTLVLHRAERADRLAAALGELFADPLDDAFAQEIVAVPARGIERWLAQQLSHRLGRRDGRADGICAGVQFPHPAEIAALVTGTDRRDPWAPDSLVWPLLEVIDASLGQDWARTLSTHLGHGTGPDRYREGRRYAVARRLAGLFDRYAGQRPAMLAAWLRGEDGDGFGSALPPDLAWQAELWRRLRDRVRGADPVTRLAASVADLRADPTRVALPQRLSLFGVTRLPASQLSILAALAEHRDVHLWLTHPSPRLWAQIAELGVRQPLLRRLDPTVTTPAHPLLAALGRDSRELQLVVTGAPGAPDGGCATVDIHHDHDEPAQSLLQMLQADLRDDRPGTALVAVAVADAVAPVNHDVPGDRVPTARPPAAPSGYGRRANTRVIAADDRSVQVHACHGPSRQVDVLREVLVGLLARDATLEPRDVLVMCPDIEVYAPLIAAGFGLADVVEDGHPAHRLRVRLADRALTQTNALLATMSALLDLADGRVTASQVLDLAAWPPVRRRFGFDDDALDRLGQWVAESGVRWGLDAERRGRFSLQGFPQNTWRAGLDRLLLGVTMSEQEQHWLGVALPLDDVGSSDVDLVGSLAELVDRVQRSLDALSGSQPLSTWLLALTDGVAALTSVPATEEWQRSQLAAEMAQVLDAAGEWGERSELTLPDVRALLRGRLGGRPTRANFRTGTLTVCTMVPMRSVPHRVVCLLGVDDGTFPRTSGLDGDDITARDPGVGERDPRGEDRQLMLDAILAATEHLVITYSGADERTGAARPPAVPLGELLDALDETAVIATGKPVREQVLIRHPLQPFDMRNFRPGALGSPGPFTFDPAALAGAAAAQREPIDPPPFLPSPLRPRPAADVELSDLVDLLVRPAQGFLRQRLGVAVRYEDEEPADGLTVEMNALDQWALGDRVLRDRLAGIDEATCTQVEWRRGMLPPGPLGRRQLETVLAEVAPLVDGTAMLRAEPSRTVEVIAELAGGRQLRGTVQGVHATTVLTIGYSKLGPRDRLRSWLRLLALVASDPETGWTATTVGRGETRAPRVSTLGPIDRREAVRLLGELVELYRRGLAEPLPLAVKTSSAYAEARAAGKDVPDALRTARQRWSGGAFPGEDAEGWHEQVWGRRAPLDALLAAPPHPDEQAAAETTRFGALAVRLWTPLRSAERIGPL